MPVITLTSDYGNKDHYVAAFKGALYQELEQPAIVDVTHDVEAFNLYQAAFILRNAYHHFPVNSVHLILVNEEAFDGIAHLVMQYNQHYFVAADNGVFNLLLSEMQPEKIVQVDLRSKGEDLSVRTIFSRIAAHLIKGGSLSVLGREITEFKKMKLPNPLVRNNASDITGAVTYVDRFGNLVTNIHTKFVAEVGKGRKFQINLPMGQKIKKIYKNYHEAKSPGDLIAIFNAEGLLEIAFYGSASDTHGGACELLGMDVNDQINIEFIT
jgi:S-adenosylmethionine hydrolase